MKVVEGATDISQDIEDYVARCTTGFIKTDSGHSIGSGTLVRYGQLAGVITCAHALQEIEDLKLTGIGFVCFPVRQQRQTSTIERLYTESILLHGKPNDWKGPDIAFLRIPSAFATQLERIATFVNLELQWTNWQKPFLGRTLEAVSGAVAERSDKPLSSPPTATTTLAVGGLLNIGRIARRSPVEGQDRLIFKPIPAPAFDLPSTYQGTSGAGVWRIGLSPHSTQENKALDRRLVGVAYYETPLRNAAKRRHIIAHGPSGIYIDLIDKIRARWPTECP